MGKRVGVGNEWRDHRKLLREARSRPLSPKPAPAPTRAPPPKKRLTIAGVRELAESCGLDLYVNTYAYFDGGSKYYLQDEGRTVWGGKTLADAVAFLERYGSE